jgi:nucleoside-diphosphate-sugar epimerase
VEVPVIVITTPTGQIGRLVLGNLLDSGEQLRVIARDPSQLPVEVREDLDIVEGSHGDAAVVDKAFAGADAVFWATDAACCDHAWRTVAPASRRQRREADRTMPGKLLTGDPVRHSVPGPRPRPART